MSRRMTAHGLRLGRKDYTENHEWRSRDSRSRDGSEGSGNDLEDPDHEDQDEIFMIQGNKGLYKQ